MNTKTKDLRAVVEQIKRKEGITCGVVVDAGVLNYIRKKIAKKLVLPDEFYTLAQQLNGICSDSAELYALNVKGQPGYFTYVVKANKEKASSEQIVLGETEFDTLVYLPTEQRYELQDRFSGSSVAVFPDLAEALAYLFGV